MSFATIERSLEAYLVVDTGDEVEDFRDHEYAFRRADETGRFPADEGTRLLALYEARVPTYYQDSVPNEDQATAMFKLAGRVHGQTVELASIGPRCMCVD